MDIHSSETSSVMEESWIQWFCNISGNNLFCEVEKSFIEDSFNLFDLKKYVPKEYTKALDIILDRVASYDVDNEELERAVTLLYGLIHARYIITAHGLETMHKKYMQRDFGECPRMLCRGHAVLPMGMADEPKNGPVKLFCPKCQDVYSCSTIYRHPIDGSFFGPTFPFLFFMTYEDLVPERSTESYVPKVFGFKIHQSSSSVPRRRQVLVGVAGIDPQDNSMATTHPTSSAINCFSIPSTSSSSKIIELRHLTSAVPSGMRSLETALATSTNGGLEGIHILSGLADKNDVLKRQLTFEASVSDVDQKEDEGCFKKHRIG